MYKSTPNSTKAKTSYNCVDGMCVFVYLYVCMYHISSTLSQQEYKAKYRSRMKKKLSFLLFLSFLFLYYIFYFIRLCI